MMRTQGKYDQASRFYLVRAQRAVLRTLIHPLAKWRSMYSPEPGYTVILGCTHRLAPMLHSNLRLLELQDRRDLHEIIIVVDSKRETMPSNFETELRRRFPQLPLRLVYYSARQCRITGMIGWAWVYSWLSWCIGISATRTRYALLHDFDAMVIREDLLQSRYETILRRPVEYIGVRHYDCNGVLASDGLVTTFEMMFDAAFVRHHFKPLDLFNHVCHWRGRTVDFDTFLYAQARYGRAVVLPIDDGDMVHPSQMICQFTELMNGRELNPSRSSLLLIPYFLSVGCEDDMMMYRITQQLSDDRSTVIDFYRKQIDVSRVTYSHARWLAAQARRLDENVFGVVRDSVEQYFDTICKRSSTVQDCAFGKVPLENRAAEPA